MDSSQQTAARPAQPDRCEFSPRLNAYHDGELDPQSAAQVEKHLREQIGAAGGLAEFERRLGEQP